jgi:glycolate oxidase
MSKVNEAIERVKQNKARYRIVLFNDPASASVCTLGGNVATNAGGMRGAKYGVTRDYVMGLEVVLSNGRIMRTGSYCMKSSSGYDLTQLFTNAEGTLGVITKVILKILPCPNILPLQRLASPQTWMPEIGPGDTDLRNCPLFL